MHKVTPVDGFPVEASLGLEPPRIVPASSQLAENAPLPSPHPLLSLVGV